MQPDTAYWLLSSIAQASAALAGLTALLLVFVLSEVGRDEDVGMPDELTHFELLGRFPTRLLTAGTILFLLATVVSLVFLGRVVPSVPVPPDVDVAGWLSAFLVGAGSFALIVFVLGLRGWVLEPETREAMRGGRRRR